MSTTQTLRPVAGRPPHGRARRRIKAGYWLAAMIALAGLVGGIAFGFASFRDAQRELDTLDRVSVPGTVTVQVSEPTERVVYYEGDDGVDFSDLTIAVTDPEGGVVTVVPYEGELVYETLDLVKGHAVATFEAEQPGRYDVAVSGADAGQLTVGDSFASTALPGVLTGLGIAVVSLVAGFTVWLVTFINASRAVREARR